MKPTIRKILGPISLTPKMLFFTVLVGALVWGVLDQFQTRRLREIFEADLSQRLQEQNQEDRIKFDNYVGAFNQGAKIIVSLRRFQEYAAVDMLATPPGIRFYSDLPPWLPASSIMRKFVKIDYALLIDGSGKVREIFKSVAEAPPPSLFQPSGLIQRLSHNQSFMTSVNGKPFLLTAESYLDQEGRPLATLMLAARLDEDVLVNSQGNVGTLGDLVALVSGEDSRIVASNRPDLLPEGTQLSALQNDFLITGKSFFDWGASDLMLQFMTFMPKQEFKKLNAAVVSAERLQRAVVSLALIVAFALIMYWITRHIRRLTGEISDISRNELNIQPREPEKGDELLILEKQFHHFTDEILESRDRLKRQAEELLREKTVYLDNILHSSDMAIIATDHDLCIKYCNTAAEKLFGYQAKEVIGKTVAEINIWEYIDPARLEEVLEIVREKGEYQNTIEQKKDGNSRFLELRASGISDNANVLIGYMLIARDVTERRRAEEELKQKTLQIEAVNRELEAFSYSVSHDLRAPLRHISSFIGLLQKKIKADLDETTRGYMTTITGAANKMSQLIDGLLALSRAGRASLQMEKIGIEALVREAIPELEAEVKGRDIAWRIDALRGAYADRTLLKLVFVNLLSNAVKYTGKRANAEITIGCREEKEETVYFVKDNGVGFDMKYADKLFTVFQRLHSESEFEGIGIGLANVHRIVSRHGGRTWAEGSEGNGATFYFTLPKSKMDELNK